MKKEIQESINFLLEEYKRLKIKKQKKTITSTEKEVLYKLKSFIGKSNE